jgi:MFS family permease
MNAAFQPADSLRSRTFIGMLIAQFLAAFNDQAIHASAMFFAINRAALTEAQAISLMPMLFYAPWAIFCTVAGYLADRFSKYYSLVAWKFAEVGITLLALFGFWIGHGTEGHFAGPWIVLSTVFLMGTHSAFFVPAKYGAMPEILTARMLSRGNGVLESLSFLAVILGTVCGGVLSTVFRGQEYYIGIILCILAVIGAAASLLIQRMPAANPTRPFPPYVYQPLWNNIRAMLRSRPLLFAVIGIAFFTFMVAFMRATVYMFGESQVPRWEEAQTSYLVGMVALGIGAGSPLVGYLSGGKVEVGLVPIGAIGMTLATVVAAFVLGTTWALVVCIICIGFFTGFYLVPLFTLLQHRAPKTSKGDAVATSNFINVTGAIAASAVFFLIDLGATHFELVPKLDQRDRPAGKLLEDPEYRDGRPHRLVILRDTATPRVPAGEPRVVEEREDTEQQRRHVVDVDEDDLIDTFRDPLKKDDRVVESVYRLGNVTYHRIRREGQPQRPAYDKSRLPTGLFLGAAAMTLFTLVLLRLQLPDLFLRTRLWARFVRHIRIEVSGMQHCPGDGAAVLAMSAQSTDECLEVLSASERTTRLLVLQGQDEPELTGLARNLAFRQGLGAVRAGCSAPAASNGAAGHSDNWAEVWARTDAALSRGEVAALPVRFEAAAELLDRFMSLDPTLRVVPVLCLAVPSESVRRGVYVIAGEIIQGGRVSTVLGALEELEKKVQARIAAGEPIAEAETH